MAAQLQQHFGLACTISVSVTTKMSVIQELRDAYEHIDERALGLRRNKPELDALSLFDYEELFSKHIVHYGSYQLDLDSEVTTLLLETREYLKSAAAELAIRKTAGDDDPSD